MKSIEDIAGRYRSIILDYEEFLLALRQPLRTTFRVSPLKSARAEILGLLSNLPISPLPFWSDGYVLDGDRLPLGNHLAHFLGHIYIQEAASMLPPLLLAPQPGEEVLDLCAAPGSKTTQLAQFMENSGLIVANDVRPDRIKALAFNLERMGVLNTVITNLNGNRFGHLLPDYFDRVLIDAPCSAEATINKSRAVLYQWGEKNIERMATIQIGLLLAGFRALKPGGTLIYSTCTYAPEENEMVVNYLLRRHPQADVMPVQVDGLKIRAGVTEWKGHQLDERVINCGRLLPQDNPTSGFFLAHIAKN